VIGHSINVICISFGGLQEKTDDNIPMPTYFRFLALLGFKIFAAEQVCFSWFKCLRKIVQFLSFVYVIMNERASFFLNFYVGRCCYNGGWIRWQI